MTQSERIEYFDRLASILLAAEEGNGQLLQAIGLSGLDLLDEIEARLDASGEYEHSRQRGSDIREAFERMRDDFNYPSGSRFAVQGDYARMRMFAKAGAHPRFQMPQ